MAHTGSKTGAEWVHDGNIHPADKTNLAGPGHHAGQGTGQKRPLFYGVKNGDHIGHVLHHRVLEDKIGIRMAGRIFHYHVAQIEAVGDDDPGVVLQQAFNRGLKGTVAPGALLVHYLEAKLPLCLDKSGIGHVVEALVAKAGNTNQKTDRHPFRGKHRSHPEAADDAG